MMIGKVIHKLLTYSIASIWLANGLFCKALNLVPRHQQIVATIIGDKHSRILTVSIGILETAMAFWVVSGVKTQLNAVVQIILIAVMNTLEFILVPDLLLWGKLNAVFALLLITIICYNEFYLHKQLALQT